MIKFLSLLLFTTTAFASTLILEKTATSGHTLPENSFTKECRVYLEGQVEATTISGDGTAIGFARTIDGINIHVIKGLNHLAKDGKIETTPMPCDAGSTIVKGFHEGKEIEIESSLDCGEKRLNTTKAASVLRSMAREICGF